MPIPIEYTIFRMNNQNRFTLIFRGSVMLIVMNWLHILTTSTTTMKVTHPTIQAVKKWYLLQKFNVTLYKLRFVGFLQQFWLSSIIFHCITFRTNHRDYLRQMVQHLSTKQPNSIRPQIQKATAKRAISTVIQKMKKRYDFKIERSIMKTIAW